MHICKSQMQHRTKHISAVTRKHHRIVAWAPVIMGPDHVRLGLGLAAAVMAAAVIGGRGCHLPS
jgi:hypothetical protein